MVILTVFTIATDNYNMGLVGQKVQLARDTGGNTESMIANLSARVCAVYKLETQDVFLPGS